MLNPGTGFSIYTRTKHCTQMSTPVQSLGLHWHSFHLPLAYVSWQIIFLTRIKKKKKFAETRKLECLLKADSESIRECYICKDEHLPAELTPEAIFIQLTKWNKLLLGLRNSLSQSIWTLLPQLSLQEEAGNVNSLSWNQWDQTRNSLSWVKTAHDGNCYHLNYTAAKQLDR